MTFNKKTRKPDHYKIIYEVPTEEEGQGGRGSNGNTEFCNLRYHYGNTYFLSKLPNSN